MKPLTAKQKDTIESMYLGVFDDELSFLAWLTKVHEYFKIEDLDTKTASRVIEDLKSKQKHKKQPKANSVTHSFWESVIRVIAKMYLKGVNDGRSGKQISSIDDVIVEIRKELKL